MNPTLQYYLGALATSNDLSNQAKELRDILFKDDEPLFPAVKHFIARQKEINADTVSMLNIAVMPGYGAEYLGLGDENWSVRAEFFKSLILQFPEEFSFKFKYADCACMTGLTCQEFYPILEEGMLQDKTNKYYPSAELFEVIQESEYNFQFDVLLLDKYLHPSSKNDFEDYVNELKEEYKKEDQIKRLNELQWKGQNTGG